MPRNSQGLYTLPAGNPVVPNTLIEANWANPTMDDIAAALTGSLPRDGSAPMTGQLTLSSSLPTASRHATSKAYVDQFLAFGSGLPIGAVVAYAGSAVPPGYFECNGQAISRTTYSTLFAAIGTTYGAGDSSTTFNVPDMRDEFIRGKSDSRPVGNKQAASFASHTHATSDPGHNHTLTDPGHTHTATQPQHNHGVNDPGHSHTQTVSGTPGSGFAYGSGNLASANTGASGTGISIQLGGGEAVTVAAHATGVSLANNTTGLSIGAAGGDETRPQNIAQIYIIKAVQDASGPVPVTGIDTSDPEMISVDNTNPVVPELVIHSNVAFGTVKLDAGGKVPLNQMPTGGSQFLGYFNASSGNLPVGTFNSGDYYAVSVQGTLTVYDPVTLTASPTLVVVGSQLHYVSGSVTTPTGWYTLTVSGATLASDVQFIPGGTISGTNVQLAISELDSETQTALAGKAPSSAATGAGTSFPPSGGISASNVTAAIQELDTETVKLSGGTMTGNLVGTDFSAPTLGVGTSATPANNFVLDASADNGTMKLARESGQDIMTVDAAGKVTFPQNISPAMQAYANAVQTLTANQNNKLLFGAKNFDTQNNFSTTTSRFTASVAGLYQVICLAAINTSAAGSAYSMELQKNGITQVYSNGSLGTPGAFPVPLLSSLVPLNAGDYLEIFGYPVVSTGTVQTAPNPLFSEFSVYYVRPLP